MAKIIKLVTCLALIMSQLVLNVPFAFSSEKVPLQVKGIHLTSWAAGSKKYRELLEIILDTTQVNAVVIAIKEYQGEVYIRVKESQELKTYVNAIPDLPDFIKKLKEKNVYTIARIVLFKDDLFARRRPELSVKNKDGSIWTDNRNIAWVDPYRKEVWDYNLSIAEKAAEIGFDEIQFDYIRFPSDGKTAECQYSVIHSTVSANKALVDFLEKAKKRLQSKKVKISTCLFGLTTTVAHDLGIGQNIETMAKYVDYICPMIYPSHYALGELGYKIPEKNPYEIVAKSIIYAKGRLKDNAYKIRPYLQDFSLNYPYKEREVRDQLKACRDNGVDTWLLWNPVSRYTLAAIKKDCYSNRNRNK